MTSSRDPSDEELLWSIVAGDEDAFVMIYRRHQASIYRFAFRMSGSATIAEDVTQEVFMTLIQNTLQYRRQRGSVSAYLFGIARNLVLRYLQRARVRGVVPKRVWVDQPDHKSLVAADDPLREALQTEIIESVRQAVLALPVHYREVVVLCDLHSMSYTDAAVVLRCPVGTVRSRLNRAHALLVEKLQALGNCDSLPHKFSTRRCPA